MVHAYKRLRYNSILTVLITLVLGCMLVTGCTEGVKPKQIFRVALFPYIPDAAEDKFKALASKIEKDFENENPSIDLVLRPVDAIGDNFYDMKTLSKWLKDNPLERGYHLVEIDTVLLGDLIVDNSITAWASPPGQHDWYPVGRSATIVKGKVYGVPHWLCGHFIFSRDESIANSGTITELVDALRSTTPGIPSLAGNLLGSWNLPALYLDAWADTNGPEGIESAISTNLDTDVIRGLKSFSKECETGGRNPCLEGDYDGENLDKATIKFARGEVDATFGYSERLHLIIKRSSTGDDIKISSAPLGEGSNPILFVDAFVLHRDCDKTCQKAAKAFVAYMNAPKTHEWILMSRDAHAQAVPRYLMPATYSAYQIPAVSSNPYYRVLESVARNGVAYPNSGLRVVRKKMRNRILAKLKE